MCAGVSHAGMTAATTMCDGMSCSTAPNMSASASKSCGTVCAGVSGTGMGRTGREATAGGRGHAATEAAMTDGATRMLPVAAAPRSLAIGNSAVAAAIDEDAAARSPIHTIPAPEGRHDWPRRTEPQPTVTPSGPSPK